MRELFTLIHGKDLENIVPRQEEEFIYEPLKLEKKMGNRYMHTKTIEALDNAHGLERIYPCEQNTDSFLHKMMKSPESSCDFLMVVAMYEEGPKEFMDTLSGIIDNLQHFTEPEKIACIVIVDGIEPFLNSYDKIPKDDKIPEYKQFFSQLFNENKVREKFNPIDGEIRNCKLEDQKESDEFAHCFIHRVRLKDDGIPLNLVFCVKHFNKRKLNTHLWFFGGFCEMIYPKYVMLLDVGTKPLDMSLYYLYKALDDPIYNNENEEQLAGCCGEIIPMNCKLTDIVVNSQIVEYAFSHMFDKCLESLNGYITVLPGAFSAYRWDALNGPLLWDDYFKSICHPELMDTFQSNIYLAEDRVLCLSLFTHSRKKYILSYVSKSKAETDAPETISKLIEQRRRWINGSWFALIDSIQKCNKIRSSGHKKRRKVLFCLQMAYFLINVIFAWFNVGLYCLYFFIILHEYFKDKTDERIKTLLISIYVLMLLMVFTASLGVKPKHFENFYKTIAGFMGIYQIFIFALSIIILIQIFYSDYTYDVLSGSEEYSKFVIAVGVILLFIIVSYPVVIILNKQWSLLLRIVQYMLMIPTYMNIFFIYAICNVNDCTWGNRPDKMTSEELDRVEEFKEFRARWVIFWVFCNTASAYLPFVAYKADPKLTFFGILILGLPGISLVVFRIIGGIVYICKDCFNKQKNNNPEEEEVNLQNRA